MNNYISIGTFAATFGFNGDVLIKHVLGKRTNFKNTEALFVEEFSNSFIPYFIQNAKSKNENETIVKLEGINSKEAAHTILNKKVWLTNEDFRKTPKAFGPVSMLGYTVINEGNALGVVEEVIEQPHQTLLKIFINGKEAFIPVHKETLQKIDKEKLEIQVVLPEGLLDVYT